MKGKLDADKLKNLCLDNFEKVIFGVLVLFFLMMVLSALKVEPYTRKPNELNDACNRAKSKLNEEQEIVPVSRNYDSLIDGIQEKLPSTGYTARRAWNPILSKEGQKRRAPRALAIRNLQVKEWHGSVQKPQKLAENMADEEPSFDDGLGGRGMQNNTEGVRCCILIGEIPVLEQETEYEEKLDTILSSSRNGMGGGMYDANGNQHIDSLCYYNYSVERALVPADGDLEKIQPQDWIDLRKKDHTKPSVNESIILHFNSGKDIGGFSGGGADIPEKYRPPQIFRKLSIADKNTTDTAQTGKSTKSSRKGKSSRQNPDPMSMQMSGMAVNGLVPAKDTTLMVPLPQVVQSNNNMQFDWNLYLPYSDEFELNLMSNGQYLRKVKGATDENTDEEDVDEEENEDEDAEEDEEEYLEHHDSTMMAESMSEQEADVRLFRYVDYTVEPGKQYIYRVKLVLHNPNYQYEPAFNLENPDDGKIKYIESDWSNVTLPVSIPLDNHFYLSGFSKFYPITSEDRKDTKIKKWSPYVSLLPVRFNENDGNEEFTDFNEVKIQVAKTKKVSSKKKKQVKKEEPLRLVAGQLLNLEVEKDSIRQLGSMSYNQNMYRNQRLSDDDEEDKEMELFDTDFVLLDVRGGKELYAPIDERDMEGADDAIKKNPRGIYSPSMVLLVGPKGDFIIQNELEDVANVYRRRNNSEMDMQMMNESSLMQNQDEKQTSRRRRSKTKDGEMPVESPKRNSSRNRLKP